MYPYPKGKTVYGTFKLGLGTVSYRTASRFDELLFRPSCVGSPLHCLRIRVAVTLSRKRSAMSLQLHTGLPELESESPLQRDALSPLSPNSPYETKPSPESTRDSWVPNRRVSDSPHPNDSSDAMPIPSPLLLDGIKLSKSLLLPLVAVAYIVFCYTVHYKTVSVKSGGLFDDSPSNLGACRIMHYLHNVIANLRSLAVIKSGVTSISIIIISLGLLPIHSLIADLRVSSFFKVLNTNVLLDI